MLKKVAFRNECFPNPPPQEKRNLLYETSLYIGVGHIDNGGHLEFNTFKNELPFN